MLQIKALLITVFLLTSTTANAFLIPLLWVAEAAVWGTAIHHWTEPDKNGECKANQQKVIVIERHQTGETQIIQCREPNNGNNVSTIDNSTDTGLKTSP